MREALRVSGLAPARLVLLVPEHALAPDRTGAGRLLDELRALGVGLALDGVGSGPSSLRRLREVPLVAARVDEGLLDQVVEDADDRAVLEGVLTLLARLRLRAVVGGVRTPQEREVLAALGCPLAQGPLLGGWLHPDDVPAALAALEAVRD